MKKIISAVLLCFVILTALLPVTAFAAEGEVPQLKSITFKNATATEAFSPKKHNYLLVLDDTSVTPTLDTYELDGEANIFVNYVYDTARHQTGVKVTMEYANGTLIYDFKYKNIEYYNESDDNYLRALMCNLGVVYPEIDDYTTEYTIYIPKDLTVLELSAATCDTGAYCEVPNEISLTSEQELNIPLTVIASNGDIRAYTFSVHRTDKSSKEFARAIRHGNTDALVKNEIFYQRPEFVIITVGTLCVLLVILILVKMFKRLAIEVEDGDEQEFFADGEE
ncbi:MAG: hypothetical protein IJR60_06685 [Eubacterium sp.]|nr:hypothetical protein [Eubacterium sp.]